MNLMIMIGFLIGVGPEMKDLMNLAMREWEDYTCLRFEEKNSLDTLFYMKLRADNEG